MKRDLQLIKTILETIESHEERYFPIPYSRSEEVFGVNEETLWMHVRLLCDYELIYKSATDCMSEYSYALTWQGYDFLDDARNETAWNWVKDNAKQASFTAIREFLRDKVKLVLWNSVGVGTELAQKLRDSGLL